MADSIILNKTASIERCLKRVREDYFGHEELFGTDFMRQDAIFLNLQRACEQSIDLANHLIKSRALGIPQHSKDAFGLLSQNGLLEEELSQKMVKMVGFRNIAIHEYSKIDLAVVRSIIENHLVDFQDFAKAILVLA